MYKTCSIPESLIVFGAQKNELLEIFRFSGLTPPPLFTEGSDHGMYDTNLFSYVYR